MSAETHGTGGALAAESDTRQCGGEPQASYLAERRDDLLLKGDNKMSIAMAAALAVVAIASS